MSKLWPVNCPCHSKIYAKKDVKIPPSLQLRHIDKNIVL